MIRIVRCIKDIEVIYERIKIKELKRGKTEETENEKDYNISYHTPNPETREISEYFHIFDNRITLLKEYYGYNVHVYSNKEVRELRKKKVQTSTYSSIIFNKDFDENDDTVSLILEKKGRMVKTPFIYLDYFILRLNDMLTVKNTEKNLSLLHNSTEVIKREFKLTTKAFEYYRYLYNFSKYVIVLTNYRKKTTRDIKEDAEFERELQKTREAYFKEVSESLNQQALEHKKAREKRRKIFINREPYKEPINKWENLSCCLNDLEKELDKLDYCIAYEFLRVHIPPKISNIINYEHYEKGKHLEKILMLAIKEAKNNDYIMNKVKEHGFIIKPSLEKEVLCS